MATSNLSPHLIDGESPLQKLIEDALTDWGDFNVGTVSGEVSPMFLRFANEVMEDLRSHPYAEKLIENGDMDVSYYVSAQDRRVGVPDMIMIAGLKARYAIQQGSEKAGIMVPMYQRMMNQILWNRLNGNTKIRLRVMDEGSNLSNANGTQSDEINGLPIDLSEDASE